MLRTCRNDSLGPQDRSYWTHWRRPGISSSVMCCRPCRQSSTLCRCVPAGGMGVRGVPVVQDTPWGHRMALERTPALTTPSVLTQAVPHRPAEPSRCVTPQGLEGLGMEAYWQRSAPRGRESPARRGYSESCIFRAGRENGGRVDITGPFPTSHL